MSVLSLALAKTHLNITVSTYDTELQTFIDAAEAAIAQKCGPLAATATTERVRGGVDRLTVNTIPAISLTSVTPVGGSALTVADLMIGSSGVVEFIHGGSFGDDWYDVVYSAGRTCPADLLMAVKELVRHLWETQRGGSSRPGSRASESASNTLPGAGYMMPFRVAELIAPYLQPGFA